MLNLESFCGWSVPRSFCCCCPTAGASAAAAAVAVCHVRETAAAAAAAVAIHRVASLAAATHAPAGLAAAPAAAAAAAGVPSSVASAANATYETASKRCVTSAMGWTVKAAAALPTKVTRSSLLRPAPPATTPATRNAAVRRGLLTALHCSACAFAALPTARLPARDACETAAAAPAPKASCERVAAAAAGRATAAAAGLAEAAAAAHSAVGLTHTAAATVGGAAFPAAGAARAASPAAAAAGPASPAPAAAGPASPAVAAGSASSTPPAAAAACATSATVPAIQAGSSSAATVSARAALAASRAAAVTTPTLSKRAAPPGEAPAAHTGERATVDAAASPSEAAAAAAVACHTGATAAIPTASAEPQVLATEAAVMNTQEYVGDVSTEQSAAAAEPAALAVLAAVAAARRLSVRRVKAAELDGTAGEMALLPYARKVIFGPTVSPRAVKELLALQQLFCVSGTEPVSTHLRILQSPRTRETAACASHSALPLKEGDFVYYMRGADALKQTQDELRPPLEAQLRRQQQQQQQAHQQRKRGRTKRQRQQQGPEEQGRQHEQHQVVSEVQRSPQQQSAGKEDQRGARQQQGGRATQQQEREAEKSRRNEQQQDEEVPQLPGEVQLLRQRLLFKDTDFLVINKPYGLRTRGPRHNRLQIAAEERSATCVYSLRGQLQFSMREKPSLVHMLGKEVTGVLLLGRTRATAAVAAEKIRSGTFWTCFYWAIVLGRPSCGQRQGVIRIPLGEIQAQQGDAPSVIVTPRAAHRGGTTAVSRWRLLKTTRVPSAAGAARRGQATGARGGNAAASAGKGCRPVAEEERGREEEEAAAAPSYVSLVQFEVTQQLVKHQIRAHCLYGLGCSILGDRIYGFSFSSSSSSAAADASPLVHAYAGGNSGSDHYGNTDNARSSGRTCAATGSSRRESRLADTRRRHETEHFRRNSTTSVRNNSSSSRSSSSPSSGTVLVAPSSGAGTAVKSSLGCSIARHPAKSGGERCGKGDEESTNSSSRQWSRSDGEDADEEARRRRERAALRMLLGPSIPGMLHLHARAVRFTTFAGRVVDVVAPLPPHMRVTAERFGWWPSIERQEHQQQHLKQQEEEDVTEQQLLLQQIPGAEDSRRSCLQDAPLADAADEDSSLPETAEAILHDVSVQKDTSAVAPHWIERFYREREAARERRSKEASRRPVAPPSIPEGFG